MTIKTDKEGPTEKQREVEEEATNEPVEEEAEPVESVLSIQLFCIDEKFEMRWVYSRKPHLRNRVLRKTLQLKYWLLDE